MSQEAIDLWWIWRGELFWWLEGNSVHQDYIHLLYFSSQLSGQYLAPNQQ